MAGKTRFAKTAVAYAVKYGPLVYEAIKHGREPAQRAVQQAWARQRHRRLAFAHAATVVDGSALRIFHEGEQVWVVFSGDEPIASYPSVTTPLSTLLQHVDLSLRTAPPPPGTRRLPSLPAPVVGKAKELSERARKVLSRNHKSED
ncbi:MAG TPA: hypothetical protein VIL34_06395 [Actinopolymorphaceae bacterium]